MTRGNIGRRRFPTKRRGSVEPQWWRHRPIEGYEPHLPCISIGACCRPREFPGRRTLDGSLFVFVEGPTIPPHQEARENPVFNPDEELGVPMAGQRPALRVLADHVGHGLANGHIDFVPCRGAIAGLDPKELAEDETPEAGRELHHCARFGRNVPTKGELNELAVSTQDARV
jgi:hypothetical protein